MIEYFKNNPIIAFVIVFLVTIFFLAIIPLLLSLISKKLNNKKKNNDYEKNLVSVEAKIYELLFSKKEMTKEEVFSYFNLSEDDFDNYLSDMINKNVIELNDENKYVLKKNE